MKTKTICRNGLLNHFEFEVNNFNCSEIKLPLEGLGEHLLGTVLELECSHGRLLGDVALHLDLAVLLPAADVVRHLVREIDLFLEELVHLSLDRVRLSLYHEGAAVVDAGHRVEILVVAREATHDVELGVEYVLAVAPVLDAVVDYELDHDFLCVFAVEAEVLAIATDDVAVITKSLFHTSAAIRRIVLNESTWPNVFGVIFTGF